MKKNKFINLLLAGLVLPLAACQSNNSTSSTNSSLEEKTSSSTTSVIESDKSWELTSPDESLKVKLYLIDGFVYFETLKDNKAVTNLSSLSLLTDTTSFESGVDFYDATDVTTLSYTYKNISGSFSEVSTACNEITVTFADLNDMLLDITFRAYDDGYTFKYGVRSVDDATGTLIVNEEGTIFSLPNKADTHSMPYNGSSKWFSYEEFYEVHSAAKLDDLYMSMPFLYQTKDGIWSLITESKIVGSNYIGSFLQGIGDGQIQTVPAFGAKKEDGTGDFSMTYPFETPWRVCITGSLETITESTLVEDVYDDIEYWKPDNYESLTAEEKEIYNYDWVEPGVVAWNWLVASSIDKISQKNWELQKQYVDLAYDMGWKYTILDGGWVPSGVTETSGFLDLMKYANEKGIKVIGWGHAMNDFGSEAQLKATLDRWKSWGLAGIKIDFFDGQGANSIANTGQGESQLTLQHYERVYQECAKRQMVVNCHGANKPTGERRQYPHVLNREAIRGNEMKTMNPRQLTSIPFLRGVVGPSDYTPTLNPLTDDTTIGMQLALHVIYESGQTSAAGRVAEYTNSPAKGFLKALPSAWDELQYVSGTPREDAVLARRSGDEWWVGGITVKAQTFEVDLSFLDGNTEYVAEIYRDGATYLDLEKYNENVTSNSKLSINASEGGGFAIRIVKK